MEIFDLHNDFLTANINVKNYLKNNKNIFISSSIYREDFSFLKALNLAKKLENYTNARVCFEDICYSDLDLDKLISLNPLYCSLTYNGENDFGYGVDYNLPLKQKGIKTAKILINKGIILDTAHLSERGILSLLDLNARVVNSHSLLKSIYPHKRNLSDYIIKQIINSGGIIGITFVGYFLGDNPATINGVVKHIDYFLQKFGDDNISIGTDFNGTDYLPSNLKRYSHFKNLKNLLIKNGYGNSTINKLFFENAKNYFGV